MVIKENIQKAKKIIPLGNVPDSVKLIDIIDTNDRNIKFYWSPMELFYNSMF